MAKAAIYIRVSTVMQLDKESRGVQRNDLIRYCNDILGIPDYEIFEDAGFSAGSTDRPTGLSENAAAHTGGRIYTPACMEN